MSSRIQKRKDKTTRRISLILWPILALLFIAGLLWYTSIPPKQVHEPRWNESNIGIDITAEERAVEAQLPGLKQSRALEAAEEKAQAEREAAIRKEEQEKAAQAQKEAEEAAAKEAEAKALAEAEAQQEAEEAAQSEELDRELVDYDIAMSILYTDTQEQVDFLSMIIDGAEVNPDYLYSMDFSVAFSEALQPLYDIYQRMNSIQPPARLADAHAYSVDSAWQLYEGALKISDGAAQADPAIIEDGLLSWGMAINYSQRAQQQLQEYY